MAQGDFFQGKTVIIADDEDFIRVHIARKLASKGLEVLQAGSGEEVLELAEKIPHAILMDVNMPGIDGFEALRRLRIMSATRHIPVILLSARAQREDLDRGFQSGADYYLTKPVTISKIMETLEKCLA
ncbi:MAG: response regulator [Spirochaetaceae bacterium]|jgi:CheY-like chemotaxis protein|nr:response regulator [Spirochaetaceae bacterium]